MRIKDVGICMLLVLLFFSFLGKALEDRTVIRGLILGLQLNSASRESDENLEEVIAADCGLELIQLKQIYEDLGLSGVGLDDQALLEENVKTALSNLRPLIKESLFKCLCENRHIRSVSEEDDVIPGNGNWYPKANSRRHMAEDSGDELIPIPVDGKEKDVSAKSAQDSSKGKGKDSGDELEIPIPMDGKEKGSKGSASESHAKSDAKSENSKTILLIAIVSTAVAVVVVVILLVICCRKCCGEDSEHKDDRPLLSLSMSDSSFNGSEKANNTQFGSLNDGKGSVSLARVESANSTNLPPSGLKPPPGRASMSGSGLPPLRPPPGRTDLLLPEGSLNPPPGATSGLPPPPHPKAPAGPPPPPAPKKPGGPPPPGPPPPPGKGGPRGPPPPPGKGGARPPPAAMKAGPSDDGKTKLKPFFWDKVNASADESMVWSQIKAGSFQFNEEMIESLFGYAAVDNKDKKVAARKEQPQFVQIIEPKKAQNLSILLRALNVTIDEVRDALLEANELPSELLETFIRMAPTSEEELKLRLYNGPIEQLGPAERFLKVLVDIPFAIKRLESLLFMGSLKEEAASVKEAFITLEAACKELRGSRLFLKLLEAVLKTGNRMNDGTYRGGAQAFKLDTLLKLADVKGADGKTTLLHFVVQEIVRSEGIRAARAYRDSKSFSSIESEDLIMEDVPDDSEEHCRNLGLEAVSSLGSQIDNVRKAAGLDGDGITSTVAKLGTSLIKTRNFVKDDMTNVEEDKGFHEALKSFVEHAEKEVMWLLEEEKRIAALIKKTGDYFHGNTGKEEGLRLFIIVRDFVLMIEKVCKEIKDRAKLASKAAKKDPPSRQTSASSETPRTSKDPPSRQSVSSETPRSSKDPPSRQTSSSETPQIAKDPPSRQTSASEIPQAPKDPLSRQSSVSEIPRAPKDPLSRQTSASEIPRAPKDPLSRQTSTSEIPRALKDPLSRQTSTSEIPRAPKDPLSRQTSASEIPRALKDPLSRQTSASEIPRAPKDPLSRQTSASEIPRAPKDPPLRQTSASEIPLTSKDPLSRQTSSSETPQIAKDPPLRQTSSSETPRTPMTPDFRSKLFGAIAELRADGGNSSSDSYSDSD